MADWAEEELTPEIRHPRREQNETVKPVQPVSVVDSTDPRSLITE